MRQMSHVDASYQLGTQESVVTSGTLGGDGASPSFLERPRHRRRSIQKLLFVLEEKYLKQQLLPQPEEQQSWSQKVVCSWKFRWLVFAVIFLNMVVIAVVEGLWDYHEIEAVTLTVERVALFFYIIEWVIRVHAGQLRTHAARLLLDLALILTGMMALLVPNDLCFDYICTTLQKYMLTIRLLRLLKLMHLSKEGRYFNAIWVLLDDMIYAGPSFVGITVFILIVMAIFAGVLNTVLGQDRELLADPELAELVLQKLLGGFRAHVLLLIFAALKP